MLRRRLVGPLLVLLCFQAQAQTQTPLSPSQQAELKALEHKLLNVEAWKVPGTNKTPIDMIVLLSKRDGLLRKTLDNKLELALPDGQAPVLIQWDQSSLALPVKWAPGAAASNVPESWAVSSALRQMNDALDEMGAPCRIDQGMSTTDLRCQATPAVFLNFLTDVDVAGCPANNTAACTEINGRRVLVRHAAKRASKVAVALPLQEVVKAAIDKAFATGIWTARDRSGSKVGAPKVMFTRSSDEAVVYVLARADYEQMPPADRALWAEAGSFSPSEVQANYVWIKLQEIDKVAGVNKDLNDRQKVALASANRFASMPEKDTALAALKYYGYDEHAVCTIGSATDNQAQASRIDVLNSSVFRKWIEIDVKKRFTSVKPDLEGLYAAFQDHTCTAAIDTAANIAKLAAAINRNHEAIAVLDTTFDAAMLADIDAQKKGFRNQADRKLAESLGVNHPTDLERLREVGLASVDAIEKARARMLATNYAGGRGTVLGFRYDEIEGAKHKMTANQVYDSRLAADMAAARAAKAKVQSDEQASYKALGLISGVQDTSLREYMLDSCREKIRMAQSATDPLEKRNNWYNARINCEQGAQR